jgi:hypothetical protein
MQWNIEFIMMLLGIFPCIDSIYNVIERLRRKPNVRSQNSQSSRKPKNTRFQKWLRILSSCSAISFLVLGILIVIMANQKVGFYKQQYSNLQALSLDGADTNFIKLPIATYADYQDDRITGKTVFISQIPVTRKIESGVFSHALQVDGKEFVKCDIFGPGVMAFSGNMFLVHCALIDSYGLTINSHLFLAQDRYIVGSMSFVDCGFAECKFYDVGFAGNQEQLQEIKNGFIGTP